MRHVCQFSCGAASAVATKMVLAEGHADTIIVNAFLKEEHADNRRFADDCERWFGHPIVRLRDEKYGASARQVFRAKRFTKGPHGAPCSAELKRRVIASVAQPGDINVIGFTVEEIGRLEELQDHFPETQWRAPLIERNLFKQDCYTLVHSAGIELPEMYRRGYSNANCIGCVKGGQAYWQAIRRDFPIDFSEMVQITEGIGEDAYFLRFRSGPRKDERMSLLDLPAGEGDMASEPQFSCSFFCAAVEDSWKERAA